MQNGIKRRHKNTDPGVEAGPFGLPFMMSDFKVRKSENSIVCFFLGVCVCVCVCVLNDFIYLFVRYTEGGRDTGRGRSRLHAGSLMQDLILGLQNHSLG